MRSIALFAFTLALAGQAMALNIVIGGSVGNVTADNFLTVQDSTLTNQCQSSCGPATTAIQTCNSDDSCLCRNGTVIAITACQQCYFTNVINDNRQMPDPRAGSTPALAAYVAACKASTADFAVPAKDFTLTLPPGWNGPTGIPLNLGETIVYVGFGAVIGIGSIVILCTM